MQQLRSLKKKLFGGNSSEGQQKPITIQMVPENKVLVAHGSTVKIKANIACHTQDQVNLSWLKVENNIPITLPTNTFKYSGSCSSLPLAELVVNNICHGDQGVYQIEVSYGTLKVVGPPVVLEIFGDPVDSIDEEETNYLKLYRLCFKLVAESVQLYFNRHVPEPTLVSHLTTWKTSLDSGFHNKCKWKCTKPQHDVLFPTPPTIPISTNFDFSLKYKLIRNTLGVPPPTRGWGNLPSPGDTSCEDDIERIRDFRNILAHNTSLKVSNTDFGAMWSDLSKAANRLSAGTLTSDIRNLEKQKMDREIKNQLLEEIRTNIEDIQREVDLLRQEVVNQQHRNINYDSRLDELESSIPPNIRKQIEKELERWIEKDHKYVPTRATKHVLKIVQDESCVTITGPSGCGKTFTARHTALVLKTEGYDIIPIYTPTDIRDYYKPETKTCFIVDDLCGNFTANQQQVDTWRQVLPVIENIVKDKSCKIIVSCRLQVFYDDVFKLLTPFTSCECNLVSTENCLTGSEKSGLIKQYTNINISEWEISRYLHCIGPMLPLLCSFYRADSGIPFMQYIQNPFVIIKKELDTLFDQQGDEGKYKICALALIVLFNNALDDKWFEGKVKHEQRELLDDMSNACGLPSGLSKIKIQNALKTLLDYLIKKHDTSYKAIHDKIFDFLAWYFGEKMIECMFDHGNVELLHERMRYDLVNNDTSYYHGISEQSEDMKFIINIPEDYLTTYLDRLIQEWSNGYVIKVFGNFNMRNQLFRKEFLGHLKKLDIENQKNLVTCKDKENHTKSFLSRKGSTPFLESCYHGYKNFTEWIFSLDVDINQTDDYKKTALHWTIDKQNLDMVRMLLERNPDVNQTDCEEQSPLYLACDNNNLDMVSMLLERNPDVNQTDKYGQSLLHLACANDNLDIVRMLLESNPDVDQTDQTDWWKQSPLHLACENNNLDMVSMLLKRNPNVNQTDKYGRSPLYMACVNDNLDIVKMLLERKSDVNQTYYKGRSPLHLACENDNLDMVSMLLDRNPDVNQTNWCKRSPLHLACEKNNLVMVRMLLQRNPEVNQTDSEEQSPLHLACKKNNLDMVSMLLDRNPDVNQTNYLGQSPLYLACEKNNLDMVRMLLQRNPDVNKADDEGWSPLLMACEKNNLDMVSMLLERNPDVNQADEWGQSPLSWACGKNNLDMVSMLLEKNPDVNQTDRWGESPLHLPCKNNNLDIVSMLLERNPDVNQTDEWGRSPLYLACKNNNLDMTVLLLENNPVLNQSHEIYWYLLYWACKEDYSEIFELFLQRDSNLKHDDIYKNLKLHWACEDNNLNMVSKILEKNPNINKTDEEGRSPLYFACNNNNSDIVSMLLERNPDVNQTGDEGRSPLYWACKNNNLDMVSMLLERNPDVNQTDRWGRSPLYLACKNHNLDMVSMLLERNPDVNKTDKYGESPLYLACENNNLDMVSMLLKRNPDVNQTYYKGRSPLHLACENNNLDMVSMLLERNPDVNKSDDGGRSPLYLACENNNLDMVSMLLERNPNVNQSNNKGRSPLHLACKNNNLDMVRMLLERNHNYNILQSIIYLKDKNLNRQILDLLNKKRNQKEFHLTKNK